MMKLRTLHAVVFSWLLVAPISVCHAQRDTTRSTSHGGVDLYSLSLKELLEVKVSTGSFLDLQLRHSPTSITVITSDQLRVSGARNLTEALEIYVPGFQYMVNKWNGLIWGMRGVAADRNTKFIVLVNGHKMNTESRDGAMTELDLGLLDDIERIEVLRGPAGLVYGSGAIAGVVNIVTKGVKQNQVSAVSTLNTWGLHTFGQSYEGQISRELSKGIDLRLDVGYRRSGGVSQRSARLYGRPHWPYPQWLPDPPPGGMPVNGSAQSTPGNLKGGISLEGQKWKFYSRLTRQVTNAAGWFPYDPWPELTLPPDSTASDRLVDGEFRSWDSFYAQTESFSTNRRQYVFNNISNQFSYNIDVGPDNLELTAGMDAVTNRIQLQAMDAYLSLTGADRNGAVIETFGERRYNVGGTFSCTSLEKLQFATGYEFRLFDIGNDIRGKNAQFENDMHPIVSDVVYFYNSVFAEGLYEVGSKLDLHFGLRYDLHTRTIQHGGVLNPKVGFMYKPKQGHYLKFVFQQSANNGSADNYEFNRNSIGDDGVPFAGEDWHYERPNTRPLPTSPIIPPVTLEQLHELKPEKARSIEVMSFHEIRDNVVLMTSLSYSHISDLFAWNQALFRVVNAGNYQFLNLNLDLQHKSERLTLGVNHSWQQPFNLDVTSQEISTEVPVFEGYDSSFVEGQWSYTPHRVLAADDSDSTMSTSINPIRDAISVDGRHFLNLSTHVTKLYVDFRPKSWLLIHSNARVFWGLTGRKPVHEFDTENPEESISSLNESLANSQDYPYLDVQNKPIVKWNIGATIEATDQLQVSFFVFDLLGGNGSRASRHSLRWQQSSNIAEHTDLYAVDFRSFSMTVNYTF